MTLETNRSGKPISVNCLKCKHYVVTWNPKLPYACRLLGFRSARMPSVVAYESTGKPCEGYEPKGAQKANAGEGAADTGSDAQSVIISIGNREDRR